MHMNISHTNIMKQYHFLAICFQLCSTQGPPSPEGGADRSDSAFLGHCSRC